MEILLYSVFGFFGLHTLLWFIRSIIYRVRHGRPRRLHPGEPAYVRFEGFHRTLHVIVIVSFLGLALTGLPLKYSAQPWAQRLASALGGFESTSFWHRVCAVMTAFYFTAHLIWLTRRIHALRRQGLGWRQIFFGPDSMVPRTRDARDLFGMVRWFAGIGRKPTFERWTYWEKFDYWAVFWGVAIIGSSGLLLWFPEFFCRFLPGEALNVAKVIHSEEALLATGFIFTIHFFNTHLRAEKFPMDMSMLTGLVSEEELRDERPELVERLSRTGDLERFRTNTPSRTILILTMLGGFLAVAIGLALLAGILTAVFS
jgi:cytochrome b subunit of formate dehydrogenase